jgi:hypothetical protein
LQIKLSNDQRTTLAQRISDDLASARDGHSERVKRWARYYRRFLNLADPIRAGDEDMPQIRVPLIQEQIILKLARELNAMLGQEAQIIADPIGPSDYRTVHKIGIFMSWRVLRYMKIVRPLAEFDFRRLLFGRSFAYAPWVTEHYPTPEGRAVRYSGPGFFPLSVDDVIVPATPHVRCLHDFPWVCMRDRKMLADLLRGEADGLYAGISGNKERLRNLAKSGEERDVENDEVTLQQDEQEGVIYSSPQSRGWQTIPLYRWYGPIDVEDPNGEEFEVQYSDDLKEILGVQSLTEMYPRKRRKRPIVEGSLLPHGAYWGLGLGQMLEQYEDEMTTNARLFGYAGKFSVGPILFAKPQAGFGPDQHVYRPFTVNWVDDPAAVQQMKFAFDPTFSVSQDQFLRAGVERLTGQSDYAAGRDINRPTAPKTATGLVSLMEAGDVRAGLDLTMLHEDIGEMLTHFWELEADLCDPNTFFRVTEDDAKGLIDRKQGGSVMTTDEFGGQYDFRMKFAPSPQQKQARKQELLTLYQLCLQNPLFLQYPNALWSVTAKIWKEFTGEDFSNVMPKPPDPGLPKSPREEWVLMLQGEECLVHPQDDDKQHFKEHQQQLEEERESERPDEGAVRMLMVHLDDHKRQYSAKETAVGLVGALSKQLAGNTPETGGLQLQPSVPVDVLQLQEQMAGLVPQGGGADGASENPVPGNQ